MRMDNTRIREFGDGFCGDLLIKICQTTITQELQVVLEIISPIHYPIPCVNLIETKIKKTMIASHDPTTQVWESDPSVSTTYWNISRAASWPSRSSLSSAIMRTASGLATLSLSASFRALVERGMLLRN